MAGQSITAILLAGGKGTRLASVVRDTPKPLIPVGGKPFLYWNALSFTGYGVRDFIISAGHLGEKIEEWVAECSKDAKPDAPTFRVVREFTPLGTGGGVIKCLPEVESDVVLVTNADTLVAADFTQTFAAINNPECAGVIVAVHQPDTTRYGSLDIDENGFLKGFREKQPGEGFISAGIYLFKKTALAGFAIDTPLSMEYDVFPTLLKQGAKIKVVQLKEAPMLDIGLPETLVQADGFLRAHFPNWF